MGYQQQTLTADGTYLSVSLSPSPASMETVVVTALGIRRAEKSLGYAAQKLNENVVKDARTTNWVNSLSGKVAGLNIQGTGSGPMGSSRITLRGESSLNLNNNQALIVVDGVPVSSRITGTGNNAHLAADSPVDFGSDVSDINPDDIESVTVLKGPGATALYGSRAAGGALIITTKSGVRKDKGLGITYNSSVSVEQVNRWPEYQYEYGEGRTAAYYSYGNTADGINTSTTASAGRAWGPKFNSQQYFQYDPNTPDHIAKERTPWVAQKTISPVIFKPALPFPTALRWKVAGKMARPGCPSHTRRTSGSCRIPVTKGSAQLCLSTKRSLIKYVLPERSITPTSTAITFHRRGITTRP